MINLACQVNSNIDIASPLLKRIRSTINHNNCFEISPFTTREYSTATTLYYNSIVSMSVPICERLNQNLNKRIIIRGEIIYIKGKIDWIKVYCVWCLLCRWNRKSLNYQQIEYYFHKIREMASIYVYKEEVRYFEEKFYVIFFCDKTTSPTIYDRHK